MKITFDLSAEEERLRFRGQFENLFNRIMRLEDTLIAYCISGDVSAIVNPSFDRNGFPRICLISFPEEAAQRFEARMTAFFHKRASFRQPHLPLPNFSIELTVDLQHGEQAEYVFSFRKFCKQTLLDFCSVVPENIRYRFERLYSMRQLKRLMEGRSK